MANRALLDRVVTRDDAMSAVAAALLAEQDGTAPSFAGLVETIAAR